jgi:hypothetical protein
LTCRWAAIASSIRSNHCEKTSTIGRLVDVKPPKYPELCSAIRRSGSPRIVPVSTRLHNEGYTNNHRASSMPAITLLYALIGRIEASDRSPRHHSFNVTLSLRPW